jgi:hypothetical protein
MPSRTDHRRPGTFLALLLCLVLLAGCDSGSRDAAEADLAPNASTVPLTGEPLMVNTDPYGATGCYGAPALAVSGTGRAAVLWRALIGSEGSGMPLLVRMLGPDGWGAWVDVNGADNTGELRDASVVIDRSGNVVVSWIRYTGTWVMNGDGVWCVEANRYDAGLGRWSGPFLVDGMGRSPAAAIDGDGNAYVAWRHSTDANANRSDAPDEGGTIRIRKFDASSGSWSDPAEMSAPGSDGPSLHAARNGNVLLLWSGPGGVHSRYYDRVADAWGADTVFLEAVSGLSNVVVDAEGNAWVAWHLLTPVEWGTDRFGYPRPTWFHSPILVSRFDGASAAWGAPVPLTAGDNVWAADPLLSMTSGGNLHATWNGVERDELLVTSIVRFDRRYDAAAASWGESPTRVGIGVSAMLAGDDAGNQVALWTEPNGNRIPASGGGMYDGATSIFTSRFDAATGSWSPKEHFEGSRYNTWASPGGLAYDASLGKFFVAWSRFEALENSPGWTDNMPPATVFMTTAWVQAVP